MGPSVSFRFRHTPLTLREMSGSASPSETTTLDALFVLLKSRSIRMSKCSSLKQQCRERLQKTLPEKPIPKLNYRDYREQLRLLESQLPEAKQTLTNVRELWRTTPTTPLGVIFAQASQGEGGAI